MAACKENNYCDLIQTGANWKIDAHTELASQCSEVHHLTYDNHFSSGQA